MCINGSDAYAIIAHSSGLDFGAGDSFSITFWMNPTSTSTYLTVISKSEESDTSGYSIGFDDTDKLRFLANLKYAVKSSSQISSNQW